jgi:hypothetical protein
LSRAGDESEVLFAEHPVNRIVRDCDALLGAVESLGARDRWIAPVLAFSRSDGSAWIRGTNIPTTAASAQTCFASGLDFERKTDGDDDLDGGRR